MVEKNRYVEKCCLFLVSCEVLHTDTLVEKTFHSHESVEQESNKLDLLEFKGQEKELTDS